MIRDWEIIRAVLVRLENSNTPNAVVDANDFPELQNQEVAYNMRLLRDAGIIKAVIVESNFPDGKIGTAYATELTNNGHDLLDTMRSDTLWNKIKEKFESKGLEMTFELVLSAGKSLGEAILN